MPPQTAIEDRQRAEDRRWGRMPGARPPLPAWLPLLVWVAGAVVLTAVAVGLVGGPGPLDDPRPERQRPGLLVDPAAFLAEGKQLYAALADATVKRSGDGGRSWSVRALP